MSPKEIVKIAKDYLRDLFADELLTVDDGPDLRLEEIENLEDGTCKVTVSFIGKGKAEKGATASPASSSSSGSTFDRFTRVIGIDERREYKVVHFDAEGNVLSVNIRPITVSR